jgi:uncharacterized protein
MDARPVPARSSDRYEVIDFLRGLALLGILILNIQAFAMPFSAYGNPMALGDRGPLDFALWTWAYVFFDQKFMTIFSMLFGAGILLMTSRAEQRGGRSAWLHYKRMFWLLVFGLIHAYLIWHGDILVPYAISGMIVFLFRRMRPLPLAVIGVVVISVSPLLMFAAGRSLPSAPPEALEDLRNFWQPSSAVLQEEIDAFRGGWLAQMPKRAEFALGFHIMFIWIWAIWRAGGLMLLGMALLKWGVLTAERHRDFYPRLWVIGWMLGLPLTLTAVVLMSRSGWEMFFSLFVAGDFHYYGSLLASLGWVGLFVSLWITGALGGLAARLVAVGRTAFSCYILTSLICTFIFYGHGLGLFGRVGSAGQWLVILIVWTILLIVAPMWLERFRFGPLEWVWRTLTYGERQPMAREEPAAAPAI